MDETKPTTLKATLPEKFQGQTARVISIDEAAGPTDGARRIGCAECQGWDRSTAAAFYFTCRFCSGCRSCCMRNAKCEFIQPNRKFRKALAAAQKNSTREQRRRARARKERGDVVKPELAPSQRTP